MGGGYGPLRRGRRPWLQPDHARPPGELLDDDRLAFLGTLDATVVHVLPSGSIRLLRAQPHLTGIGFDLPTSGPAFEKAVARGGLDDRLSFAGGDFRTSGFPAADAVVFGHVMIDWDVEVGRMLLAKAYEALPEGGAVLIYDTLVGEDRRDSVGALIVSLHMLVDQRGGKGCTTEECFGRLKDAGFRDCRVQPLTGTTDHLSTAVK
ncbi:methyltransferase [Streptomyces sp. NBC_00872]|uniref:methyltransferase n=1 Tax=Streptomyces sp. NBC_00872 TaxID=2903686 RepID=UPI003867499E|nr:methyltransferase [Streptomyces sp. NBC_00872]